MPEDQSMKEFFRGLLPRFEGRRISLPRNWWAPIVIASLILAGCMPSPAESYDPTAPPPSYPTEPVPIGNTGEFAQALGNTSGVAVTPEPDIIKLKEEKPLQGQGLLETADRLLAGENKSIYAQFNDENRELLYIFASQRALLAATQLSDLNLNAIPADALIGVGEFDDITAYFRLDEDMEDCTRRLPEVSFFSYKVPTGPGSDNELDTFKVVREGLVTLFSVDGNGQIHPLVQQP